jgi:hypothetical protein
MNPFKVIFSKEMVRDSIRESSIGLSPLAVTYRPLLFAILGAFGESFRGYICPSSFHFDRVVGHIRTERMYS